MQWQPEFYARLLQAFGQGTESELHFTRRKLRLRSHIFGNFDKLARASVRICKLRSPNRRYDTWPYRRTYYPYDCSDSSATLNVQGERVADFRAGTRVSFDDETHPRQLSPTPDDKHGCKLARSRGWCREDRVQRQRSALTPTMPPQSEQISSVSLYTVLQLSWDFYAKNKYFVRRLSFRRKSRFEIFVNERTMP